ncbi:hypothetical protein J2Z40_003782 [Cytobacillus eiseniae]|uniref:DUF1835 domain-containing protein n=1 Tax=Cytobacillus eiseniae TaxID=762947 RepID=A0ABS4RLM5_9BACI|nr:DUF1835 domain-containing protein [Cytobacillus eiseniae]MBP2243194.1 hypothetical protein [Cytobacillus eiseniae]
MQTYELEHEDTFEMFNHEESNPLVGKGYGINLSDVNTMVKVVNKCIQKYRPSFSSSLVEPVHIVSSESAAGSLRVGLERPKVVIGFPDSFSIGPLWKLDVKEGQTFRNQWVYEHINYELDDFEYENKFANTLRKLEDIPQQVPIYIWYGNNADEQTGLRYLLFLLRDKTNDIFLMNSTELYKRYIEREDRDQKIFHTAHIEQKELKLLFDKGQTALPISKQKRMQLQEEWNSLAQTKEVLRLWLKGEIKGINEDHFDPLIIKTIEMLHRKQEKKEFIKAGMVIGEILSESTELMNAFFLEYRIRHLLYSGILELKGIPKSMRHYSVRL